MAKCEISDYNKIWITEFKINLNLQSLVSIWVDNDSNCCFVTGPM